MEFLAARRFEVRVFSAPQKKNLPLDIPAAERHGIGRAEAIGEWLRRLPRPLALLACNDICGQQVLNACRSHGIKVPEEVAVMGVDDDEVLCSLCDPPLSSVEPDTERLGYEAAAMLDRMMRRRSVRPALVKIPPHRVVERASSDTVPIEDPITAKALRYIRDHVGDGIAVKDVQLHVQRSRTDLEQRFRRHLNVSVSTEIWRRRMDRVCLLLQETDLRLGEIAEQSGFATDSHLCRSFKARFKMTPADYRLLCKNRQRDW